MLLGLLHGRIAGDEPASFVVADKSDDASSALPRPGNAASSIGPGPSGAKSGPFVVLTSQGGLLVTDATSGNPIQSACRFRPPERGLWAYDGTTLRPLVEGRPVPGAGWQVTDAGDGHVGFRTEGGTFVCASPRLGPVSLHAPELQAWERFRLLSLDDLDLIANCAASRWLVDDDARPTEPDSWRFVEGFRIVVAGRSVAIGDLLTALKSARADASPAGVPMSFMVFHGTCTPSRAFLYNPLIYATIGGADSFFEQLALCFASIERFGRYDGSYRLVCDRTRSGVARYFGSIDQSRWDNVRCDLGEVEDIARARRTILESAEFDAFQPIIYLDSDIVCDQPIESLLVAAIRSSRILISSEFPGLSIEEVGSPHGNWFGEFLYENDRRVSDHRCINNGIFAARNRQIVLEPLATVAESWSKYKRIHPDAHRAAYDQPFYSYVLQCLDAADVPTMNRWVRHLQGVEPSWAYEPSGFAHFNIGVGLDKTRAMERYLSLLDERHSRREDQRR